MWIMHRKSREWILRMSSVFIFALDVCQYQTGDQRKTPIAELLTIDFKPRPTKYKTHVPTVLEYFTFM
jgi:hypothetical protein